MLQSLIRDLVGAPAPPRRLGRHDDGVLTELLAEPAPTKCPYCGERQPPVKLRTRKRRITALRNAAGAILHLEIEP
jgi:hypothetical protein